MARKRIMNKQLFICPNLLWLDWREEDEVMVYWGICHTGDSRDVIKFKVGDFYHQLDGGNFHIAGTAICCAGGCPPGIQLALTMAKARI